MNPTLAPSRLPEFPAAMIAADVFQRLAAAFSSASSVSDAVYGQALRSTFENTWIGNGNLRTREARAHALIRAAVNHLSGEWPDMDSVAVAHAEKMVREGFFERYGDL